MPIQYASLAEVKQGNFLTGTEHDAVIPALIMSARKAIDNYCNRKDDGFRADGQPTAREFVGSGDSVQWIDECARITQVEVKDSATDSTYTLWSASDWIGGRGNPQRGAFGDREFRPYQWLITAPAGSYTVFTSGKFHGLRGFAPDPDMSGRGVPTIRVTANWGYSMDTPPEVKQACIVQVGRWLMRGKSQQSDTTVTPEFGMTAFRRSYEFLDQEVAMILIAGGLVRKSGI